MTTAASSPAEHWLLAVDADAIQSYVYESSRLPEIRGASALLCDLGEYARAEAERRGGEVCYSAGGSLTAYFTDRGQAAAAAAAVEQEYLQRTLVATATTALVACPADPRAEAAREVFQAARQEAAAVLRTRKLSRPYVPFFEAVPYARRCASCDARPAAAVVAERPICEPCRLKVERGRQVLQDEAATRRPATLEDLNDGRAVGMVLLDGDGMGAQLNEKTWRQLQGFSRQLQEALAACVAEALAPLKGLWQRVYVGGDDLLLFVPGHEALEVARRIGVAFGARLPGCSLSGGVVIAHPHYPVYYLHRLARDLERSAKRGRALAGAKTGWLDFEVLRSSAAGASGLQELREAREDESTGELRRLHDRPYSLEGLGEAVTLARALRAGSYKGQLLMMTEAQAQGLLQGAAFLMYQAGRDGTLRQLLTPLTARYASPPGWRQRNEQGQQLVRTTCLPDLADIYDCL